MCCGISPRPMPSRHTNYMHRYLGRSIEQNWPRLDLTISRSSEYIWTTCMPGPVTTRRMDAYSDRPHTRWSSLLPRREILTRLAADVAVVTGPLISWEGGMNRSRLVPNTKCYILCIYQMGRFRVPTRSLPHPEDPGPGLSCLHTSSNVLVLDHSRSAARVSGSDLMYIVMYGKLRTWLISVLCGAPSHFHKYSIYKYSATWLDWEIRPGSREEERKRERER